MLDRLALASTIAVATGYIPTCGIFATDQNVFAFGKFLPSGAVTPLVTMPAWNLVVNGNVAEASNNTFLISPGGLQDNDAIFATFQLAADGQGTVNIVDLSPVPGKGPNGYGYISDMSWDSARNVTVAFLQSGSPEFNLIADVLPNGTVTTVYRDITSYVLNDWSFVKQGCSWYDESSGVYYIVAGAGSGKSEAVVGIPLDASQDLIVIPTAQGFDLISLGWSDALGGFVALARDLTASPEGLAYVAYDQAGKAWRRVFTYPAAQKLQLQGMGLVDISGDGVTAVAALQDWGAINKTNPYPLQELSFVDLTTGQETDRTVLPDFKNNIADIVTCEGA